jgi:hypothetical protein
MSSFFFKSMSFRELFIDVCLFNYAINVKKINRDIRSILNMRELKSSLLFISFNIYLRPKLELR